MFKFTESYNKIIITRVRGCTAVILNDRMELTVYEVQRRSMNEMLRHVAR